MNYPLIFWDVYKNLSFKIIVPLILHNRSYINWILNHPLNCCKSYRVNDTIYLKLLFDETHSVSGYI